MASHESWTLDQPTLSKEDYERMEEEFDECEDTSTVLKGNGIPALMKGRWDR